MISRSLSKVTDHKTSQFSGFFTMVSEFLKPNFYRPTLFLLFIFSVFTCSAESVCVGGNTDLYTDYPGGQWTSSDNSIATVDNNGTVTGVLEGDCIIYYVDPFMNTTPYSISVFTFTISSIAGQDTLCVGGNTNLSSSPSGGIWSSSDNGIAMVNQAGVVTGVSTGTCTISYFVNSGGCSGTVYQDVVVVDPVAPTLTLVSPPGSNHQILEVAYISNDTIYYQTLDTIRYAIGGSATGAYLASGPNSLPNGVTGWFDSGEFIIAGTPIIVYPPAPTDSVKYNYQVKTSGCDSLIEYCNGGSGQGTYDEVWDNITLAPACTHEIIGANYQSVCFGDYVSFIFEVTGSPDEVYATNLPSGLITNYNGNYFYISGYVNDFGMFNFTVEAKSSSCLPAISYGNLHVEGLPDLYLSSPAGTDNQTICSGSNIQEITYYPIMFSAAIINVTGLPAGLTAYYDGYGMHISGIPSETGIFTYTVTSENYCGTYNANGTISVNESELTGEINGNGLLCQGSSANFSHSAIGGIWSSSDTGVISVDQYGNALANSNGSAYINYSVMENGCPQTDSIEVIIGEMSTLVISSPAGTDNQQICLTNAIESISYTSAGAANNVSLISGSFPAGVTGYYVSGEYIISGTPTESGIYAYTISTSGSTCGEESILSGVITVDEPAVINPLDATVDLCLGNSISHQNMTPGGIWSSSDPSIVTIDQNGFATGNAEGIANLTYTLTSGVCSDSTSEIVTVIAPPFSDFSYTNDGLTVQFNNNSSPGNYNWDFGNNSYGTDFSPTITYPTSGTYVVTLSVTNSCGEDIHSEIVSFVSINEIVVEGISVYPNPFSEKVFIELPLIEKYTVELYDMTGKILFNRKINQATTVIDLSEFHSGEYILQIECNGKTGTYKLVKN